MKITHLKSATELIEANGVKILTDPWLVDGEYYGSWYHVPSYRGIIEDIEVDYIYISHIHPDHLSIKTLARIRKNIPVLVHKYATSFLKNNIERLGFNVKELEHNTPYSLGNNTEINILAADNCNPVLCAKFIGCAPVENKTGSTQIDSMCLISDGKFTLINTNDCPYELAKDILDLVLLRYRSIDFLLVGYAGAGPYPQCFHFKDKQAQLQAAYRKKNQFLQMAFSYIKHVSPKFFMPFAGTYTLGGHLSALNDLRGVPDITDAFSFLVSQCKEKRIMAKGILLNSGACFDLRTERSSEEYRKLTADQRQSFIRNISEKKYDYELLPHPKEKEILDIFPAAWERFERKRQEIEFTTDTRLLIKISEDKIFRLQFGDGFEIEDPHKEIQIPGYVMVSCDTRLLLQLLKGPRFAHWNNAEIGSHLRFRREPDIFERGIYYCLYFLHV